MRRLLKLLPLVAAISVPGAILASNSTNWYQGVTNCYTSNGDACVFSSFDSSGSQTENIDIRLEGVDVHSEEIVNLRKSTTDIGTSAGSTDIAGITVSASGVSVATPVEPLSVIRSRASNTSNYNTLYSGVDVKPGEYGDVDFVMNLYRSVKIDDDDGILSAKIDYRYRLTNGSWSSWSNLVNHEAERRWRVSTSSSNNGERDYTHYHYDYTTLGKKGGLNLAGSIAIPRNDINYVQFRTYFHRTAGSFLPKCENRLVVTGGSGLYYQAYRICDMIFDYTGPTNGGGDGARESNTPATFDGEDISNDRPWGRELIVTAYPK